MTRFLIAALAAMLTLTCVPRAEARIFEPQRDWWHSGRTCVESRAPAGLDWDGSAPRACVEGETAAARKQPHERYASVFKNEMWSIAYVGDELGKRSSKSSVRA